jgi:hypothetical protein
VPVVAPGQAIGPRPAWPRLDSSPLASTRAATPREEGQAWREEGPARRGHSSPLRPWSTGSFAPLPCQPAVLVPADGSRRLGWAGQAGRGARPPFWHVHGAWAPRMAPHRGEGSHALRDVAWHEATHLTWHQPPPRPVSPQIKKAHPDHKLKDFKDAIVAAPPPALAALAKEVRGGKLLLGQAPCVSRRVQCQGEAAHARRTLSSPPLDLALRLGLVVPLTTNPSYTKGAPPASAPGPPLVYDTGGTKASARGEGAGQRWDRGVWHAVEVLALLAWPSAMGTWPRPCRPFPWDSAMPGLAAQAL